MRSTSETVHLIAATNGFISFFLLWLAVVWGMILRNGWAQTRIKHSTAYGIHMVMALLGLCLGTVHTFTQLADPTGTVFLMHVFVPFVHPYDPIGIGVGVISLQLLAALTMSILIQRALGYTRWRAMHTFAYVAFMLLVAHVLISGTDTAPTPVWGAVFGMWLVTVVMWLTSTGIFGSTRRKMRRAVADRQRSQEFTVNVDALHCARFGFCEHEAPEVFRLRSDGRLSYKGSVPLDQMANVMRAVEVCPARAIGINQLPTKVFTPQQAAGGVEPVSGPGGLVNTGRHRVIQLGERRPVRRGRGR